jgi:hypothetical protein
LSGWVEYLHVFSDTDVVKVPFVYLYTPETMRLSRVPLQKQKGKENQSEGGEQEQLREEPLTEA